MGKITLYHTEGCHLCEQALALLQVSFTADDIELVDIIDDYNLISQYQTSIPVVKSSTGEELFWPFDHDAIEQFLNR